MEREKLLKEVEEEFDKFRERIKQILSPPTFRVQLCAKVIFTVTVEAESEEDAKVAASTMAQENLNQALRDLETPFFNGSLVSFEKVSVVEVE